MSVSRTYIGGKSMADTRSGRSRRNRAVAAVTGTLAVAILATACTAAPGTGGPLGERQNLPSASPAVPAAGVPATDRPVDGSATTQPGSITAGPVAPTSVATVPTGPGSSGAPSSGDRTASRVGSTASTASTAPTTDSRPTSPAPASTSTAPATASTAPASTSAAPATKTTTARTTSTTSASTSSAPSTTTPTVPVRDTLLSGMQGQDVKALQQKLNSLGYWNGAAGGTYGDLTSQAVMAYQKAAGIEADGAAGPQTTAALARNVRPTVRTTTGSAIEIDKEQQLVKVVIDGRLKYIFNTSTGSGQTYIQKGDPGQPPTTEVATTPEGSFTIERSIDGMRKSKLGELWRPRYFYDGYALHGSNSVPAYPASHGCVRLANGVIDFVWSADLAPIGRTVLVY